VADSISVVIRCFNEERTISRLLTGIAAQTVPVQQIIVVDSGSTDGTLSVASRFPVEVHSIAPADFSFGRSLNLGCRAASGDLVVVASAHVYPVYDTWLERLTAPFVDPAIGLSYGRQVGGPRTAYSERQVLATWFPATSNARQHHPFANNANSCIRRQEWTVMRYDEDLTGLEDLDYARRLLGSGREIAYVAEAPVVHMHEETWKQVVNRYRREAIAHRRIFHDQRMSRLDAIRLAAANILSDYTHAIGDRKLLRNLFGIPRFRLAQFLGTYEGFAQHGAVSAELRRRFYYPRTAGSRDEQPADTIGLPIVYDDRRRDG
jgi:glycosyltransferase involved in cell wall biosynthesis